MRNQLATAESLKACRIRLINLEERLDTASAASELVFHAYGAIAGFEQQSISECMRDGIAAAREPGTEAGTATAGTEEHFHRPETHRGRLLAQQNHKAT